MALTDQAVDIEAQLTNKARTMIARATMGEVVFQVIGFGLGRYGYNPANVIEPLEIEPADTELRDKVYPTAEAFSHDEFVNTESPSSTVRVYNCRVGLNQADSNANFGLGELGLYAKVVRSTTDESENNEVFLYAISHFPIVVKTRRDTLLRRVVVSY